MVIDPRVQTGPRPQITWVVKGRARCLPDGSGYAFPAPRETLVEIHLQQPSGPGATSLVASALTKDDGTFEVVVTGGVNLIANPFTVRLVNPYTGEQHGKPVQQFVLPPSRFASPGALNVEFDAGEFILPWDPQLSLLGMIDVRRFKHAPPFASGLANKLIQQAKGTICLLREFDIAAPDRDRDADRMFKDLESEAAAGSTALSDRIAAALGQVKPFNAPPPLAPVGRVQRTDIFTRALQQLGTLPVARARRTMAWTGFGKALATAFNRQAPRSFIDMTLGMPTVSALLFTASHVAQKHTVTVRLSGLVSMAFKHHHRHYNLTEVVIP